MSLSQFDTVIFDLGDVLFSWSSQTKTCISSKTLRAILSSPTWFDYERGRLQEEECYRRVGEHFSLNPDDVRQAFIEARSSLCANDDLIALIRELKEQSQGALRIYAMSNISLPDYEVLKTKPADWSIFEHVYTSGAAGERKPNLGFYRQVIADSRCDPYRTIFVDDKLENVLSARSLGMQGIVFDKVENVRQALRNALGDPCARGQQYLRQHAGKHKSFTNTGVDLQEDFAQLLMLEATEDLSLVDIVGGDNPSGRWNFFQGKGQLTSESFPFDLDTTSIGVTVMKRGPDVASSVMNEMLEYVNDDGIIQTYFDRQRPRFDPVVCVNVLNLFYTYGRGRELRKTLEWVHEVLLNRAYLDGTRYYETAECFLFFISRLLQSNKDEQLHAILDPVLRQRIKEHIGKDGDALALAMRILACDYVGIRNEVDLRTLLALQCEDGGWGTGWMYKYGSSDIKIGNRGLTTALAVKAVQGMTHSTHPPPSPIMPFFETPRAISPEVVPPIKKRHRRSDSLRNSLQWLLRRKSDQVEVI